MYYSQYVEYLRILDIIGAPIEIYETIYEKALDAIDTDSILFYDKYKIILQYNDKEIQKYNSNFKTYEKYSDIGMGRFIQLLTMYNTGNDNNIKNKETEKMSKIIVIGANHAGTAAINTILDNYEDDVVVFDGNSNISFLGCGMALWIGKQIDGPEGLFYSSKELLEEKGAIIYMETIVEHVDYEKKIVYAKGKDGKEYQESYDKLILACGSLPMRPTIPGSDLENVQMVKLYQNAQDVIEKLNNPELKNIVVVGGGYIGVELAEAFRRCDKEVTLIDCADTCLGAYYDHSFTDLMNQNLTEHGIKLAFNQSVLEIKGNQKVESVVTDKGEYAADMVILAVGFKPNNELGKDVLKLYSNGAYLVNKNKKHH